MKYYAGLLVLLILTACLMAGCTSPAPQTPPNNIPTIPIPTPTVVPTVATPVPTTTPVEPALEGVTVCVVLNGFFNGKWYSGALNCNFIPETTSEQYKSTHPEANRENVIVIDGDHAKNNWEGIHNIYNFQKMKKVKIEKCEQGVGTVCDCARCGIFLDHDNGEVVKINLSDRTYLCGHDC